MANSPFQRWLCDVASDPVLVNPEDVAAEAQGNLWTFGLSREEANSTTCKEVEDFAHAVIEARRAWLINARAEPMWIYWWHDEMAGQLRFSLVSVSHGRLPFGVEIVRAQGMSEILQQWLGSGNLEGLPWEDFVEVADQEEVHRLSSKSVELLVWFAVLP